MKKITVVCLDNDKARTTAVLQKQGIVHVNNIVPPTSPNLDVLLRRQADLSRVLKAASELEASGDANSVPPEQSLGEAVRILDDMKKHQEHNVQIDKDIALLAPWGSFDSQLLEDCREHRVHIALCSGSKGNIHLPELPEGAFTQTISENSTTTYYAVFSPVPLDDITLPRATLPECTNERILLRDRQHTVEFIEKCQKLFESLAQASKNAWQQYAVRLEDDIQLARATNGMGTEGILAYLVGYVPENKLDAIRNVAYKEGWGIRYEDIAEDDDQVPTLLNIPSRFKMAQQIFDFIGILPGYFETDVSIAMFVFLSLFCGILIGDAGYGALMSALTIWGYTKAKTENARDGMKLLVVISLCILAFGWLSGNWFGLDVNCLPRFMKGIPWLYDDTNSNHVKLLCFFIGAFHTSLARAWNAYNHQKDIRSCIGHLGWGTFLWGNFFLAKLFVIDGQGFGALPFEAVALYAIGFLIIITCGINWKNMGEVIYSPFAFINSFVDVLSYIRLFAVGLSGVYIAKCFNQMAGTVTQVSPWCIPVSVLILALGHALNIAMALLSVLVHGIRLNTLEFSGHIDVSWCGKPYKPLVRNDSAAPSNHA